MRPLQFARLFEEFRAPSWEAWMGILRRITPEVRELFVAAGRGSGKSRTAGLLAAWAGVVWATERTTRAPGESIYVGCFAPDRKQAGLVLRYIVGLLRSRPELEALLVSETSERIVLANAVIIEVLTASKAAPRGRSYALAIIEEAAFLPAGEDAADPDVELLRAVRPALARVAGSLLVVIGSPYARRGILHDAVQAGEAPDRIVVTSDTLSLNPTFSKREIDRAFEVDPVAAASEYGRDGTIDFRRDVSGLLTLEALAAVTPAGVRELAPEPGRAARGHFDAATGSGGDAAALGVAFDGRPATLAAVRQWRPPFSPSAVIGEAAEVCRAYGIRHLTIDRFAPGFVADAFRDHGITCSVHALDTSGVFLELLSLVNAGGVVLLDDPALQGELRRLERRASPGGRQQIGHPPRGHDDVAAAAAAALVVAQQRPDLGAGWANVTWLHI